MTRLVVFTLVPAFLGVAVQSYSQSASLSGVVKDASGAAVPETLVMVASEASKTSHEVSANSNGEFTITGLDPGTYTVSAKRPGFYKSLKEGLKLRPGKTVFLNIQLDLSRAPNRLKRIKRPFGMRIERKAHTQFERELIGEAEQAPCPDGNWTHQKGNGVRWPSCLNSEAVKYYAELTSRYVRGDFPFAYPELKSGRAYYHADVKRDRVKKRWKVELVLEYSDYCGNLCGTFFEIIRTIYFDDDKRIVEIEGDDEGAHGGIS